MIRNIWLRAWREGKLTMTFKTESQAHQARMRLYSVVKREKHMQDFDNPEMVEAAQGLEIVFGDSKNMLLLRRKSENPLFEVFEEASGKSFEETHDPNAMASAQKVADMLKELDGPVEQKAARFGAKPPAAQDEPKLATEYQKNPFYTRS